MTEIFNVNKKEPITSVLQNLETNATIEFPLERTMVVRATIQILMLKYPLKYSTKKNNSSKVLEVTRIS